MNVTSIRKQRILIDSTMKSAVFKGFLFVEHTGLEPVKIQAKSLINTASPVFRDKFCDKY